MIRKNTTQSWIQRHGGKVLAVLGIFFLGSVLAPVVPFLSPSFLFSRHLVLFINENEARPCGGFVTAFGELRPLWPHFFLKNSYHFEPEGFGKAEFPLDRVASEKKFWDLGTNPNLEFCARDFLKAYNDSTGQDLDSAIMVQFSVIEALFEVLGGVKIGDQVLSGANIFYTLSQDAADIDRHDEGALGTRKTFAAEAGKKLLQKVLFRPDLWRPFTEVVEKSFVAGTIFVTDMDQKIAPEASDFSVIEWNLGGGKSSRFLQKKLRISLREKAPHRWEISGKLEAENLGEWNEPVGQFWRGVFEVRTPDFLGGERFFIPAYITPGKRFAKDFSFEFFEGDLQNFSLFSPPGQKLFLDFSVTVFPEQFLTEANMEFSENVGHFFGVKERTQQTFSWQVRPDRRAPFITLHDGLPFLSVSDPLAAQEFLENPDKKYLYAEIHFHEVVELQDNFSAIIIDRDFENERISDNPMLESFYLMSDGRTLLLQFTTEEIQKHERFYLSLFGVSDLWGNEIKRQKRTLIWR